MHYNFMYKASEFKIEHYLTLLPGRKSRRMNHTTVFQNKTDPIYSCHLCHANIYGIPICEERERGNTAINKRLWFPVGQQQEKALTFLQL